MSDSATASAPPEVGSSQSATAAAASAGVLRRDVLTPDEGVVKDVTRDGVGEYPNNGDEITAHYTGRLLDGTIFDSSVTRGKPFKFTLGQGQVIKGWDLGFASMRKGETGVLTLAAAYAYGASGSPPTIPPGATLRFEVELLGFGPKPKELWQMNNAERIAEAEARKGAGNAAFTGGDLAGAVEEYAAGASAIDNLTEDGGYEPLTAEQAAAVRALRVTLRCNLAQVHLKRQAWAEAAKAAGDALKADPGAVKALFRRGVARSHLFMLEEAKADLAKAAKLAPGDAAVRAELERVTKAVGASKAREKAAFGGVFNKKGFELGGTEGRGKAGAPKPPAGLSEFDDSSDEEGAAGATDAAPVSVAEAQAQVDAAVDAGARA